jgi:hypothetical protein
MPCRLLPVLTVTYVQKLKQLGGTLIASAGQTCRWRRTSSPTSSRVLTRASPPSRDRGSNANFTRSVCSQSVQRHGVLTHTSLVRAKSQSIGLAFFMSGRRLDLLAMTLPSSQLNQAGPPPGPAFFMP